MKTTARLAATLAFLALTACASGQGAATRLGGVRPDDSPVLVNVTNNYALPAAISAVGCGTEYRLGIAYPGFVSHYVLRQAMLACGGMVEFVAQPADRKPPVRAGRELLKPGDVVDFQITMHLIASYTSVRS